MNRQRRPAWGKIALVAIMIALVAAAWRYAAVSDLITRERIAGMAGIVRNTSWAPAAVVLSFIPAAFLMFPRPLLTLLSVLAFGPLMGLAYSITGVLAATLATYGAGRLLSYETVRRLAGDKVERLTKALRAHGLIAVIAVNMVPIPPFGVQGVVAGALRVKARDYVLGCLVAMAPGTVAAALFGKELAASLDESSTVSYVFIGLGIGVFVLFTVIFRRLTRKVWE